nr:hypothetical protein [Nocardia macrotermitis]
MSTYMSASVSAPEGIEVNYHPERPMSFGDGVVPAGVDVRFTGTTAYLSLSIEDARALAEQLPQILMLHDAAERVAAEKAVA